MTQRGFVEVFQQMFGDTSTPGATPASKLQPSQAAAPTVNVPTAEVQDLLEDIERLERLIAAEQKRQGKPVNFDSLE